MAYSSTVDERYGGGYYQYTAGYYDAPSTLNSIFFLKQDGFAYGTLTYNNLLDQDVYSLGVLNLGHYKVDVNDLTWDSSNFDSGSVSNFSVLDSYGSVVGTSYGSYADINFTVNSANTYYVKLTGGYYSSAQYSLSYTKTGELVNSNSPAIFGQSTYNGSASVGNFISVDEFIYFDANGNSDNFVDVNWYVDGIYQNTTDSTGSFLLLSEYLGKNLSFKLSFFDDLGNFEISNFYVVGTVLGATVNDRPTLTSFGTSVKTTNEDTAVAISFAELISAGNEADVDGTISSFVVKAVSTGSLTINGTAWNATTNNTIDATKSAVWTPAVNANGTLNAFTVVAKDDSGAESATAVQATVAVTPVNDSLVITGTSGNDNLMGTSGADIINAKGGNDTLNGGAGADRMFGGAGNDIYVVDNTSDRVYETTTTSSGVDAGGLDTVQSSVSFTLGQFVENLTLTGTAAIKGTGNSLNNTLAGNAGNNTLNGGAGADTLMGGLGTDILIGGIGADRLYGGLDTVEDIFKFLNIADSNQASRDNIYNFISGTDKIDLSGIDANSNLAGNQAFLNSSINSNAQDYSIWGIRSGANFIISADTDGNASTVDFQIQLIGVTQIDFDDFVV